MEVETDKTILCKLHLKKRGEAVNLDALSEVFSRLKYPFILGGNCAVKETGGLSYWAAEPKEVFEFNCNGEKPFEKLDCFLNKYKADVGYGKNLPDGIFCGGWMGFFGYELGRFIEKLPQRAIDDMQMPLVRLCFYDKIICYDHQAESFYLFAMELSDDNEEMQGKIEFLEKLLEEAGDADAEIATNGDIEKIDFDSVECNMTREYYVKAFEKIKRYIYDGDVYQINFSQRFECDFCAEPIKLFNWQNKFNPSGYAAYIDCGEYQIVSTSPEMFMRIHNGLISTKPIKGTRPRFNGEGAIQINEKNFKELSASEKEKAELNMIVDLERNDVAKICVPGTRKVTQPRTIEAHPTVYHAVATVEGKLKPEMSLSDCLKAMFPGGSITGAPKIRAMEIIDELEPTQRGIYTGSIGFIGMNGNVCLNIAIRTIIIRGGKAFVQTGGGIVADSDADAEWAETLTKARALIAGIKAVVS